MFFIFITEDAVALGNAPINIQIRIAQQQSAIGLGMIEVIALVSEGSRITEHREPVRKTARDKELSMVLAGEFNGKPLTKGLTLMTQVHRHIQYPTLRTTNEFSLRKRRTLEMQSTHHTVGRTRLVVLYELGRDTGIKITLTVIRLNKISAGIAEELRLDNEQTFDRCLDYIHFLPKSAGISPQWSVSHLRMSVVHVFS